MRAWLASAVFFAGWAGLVYACWLAWKPLGVAALSASVMAAAVLWAASAREG